MKIDRRMALLVLGALLFALSGAQAQAVNDDYANIHAEPGSLLIFPLFDSNVGKGTLITVTNVNTSTTSCGNTYKEGDVCVHYVYVDGEDCDEFDRTECLTPGDTLTVIADQHNPHQQEGYLWVEARDPETFEPINYNFLIGSAIIVESDLNFVWSYTPFAFKSHVMDCPEVHASNCGYCFTDVADYGWANFDGVEYDQFPDDLILDNFFQQSGGMSNELTLMSTKDIGDTNVTAYIWNNDEEVFSKGFVFTCHTRGPLSLISQVVTDLGGVSGQNPEKFQTGWIEFRSTYGLLGVFKHAISRANNGDTLSFGAGRELIADGEQTARLERF